MDAVIRRESSSTTSNLKPHDVLWFFDGNVVLATDSMLFKVHKGVLSFQSSVFKDLFEFPTIDGSCGEAGAYGGISPELYEGVHLVTLAGDKGTDVEHLLRAAYERQYYYRDDNDISIEVFTALLCLSTKYDFKHIRSDLIKQMAKSIPLDQSTYELACNSGGKIFNMDRNVSNHPFTLLQVVLETDVDVFLPILYYACCSFYMDVILAETRSLARGYLDTLLIGKEKLDNRMNELIARLPDILHDNIGNTGCLRIVKCLSTSRFSNLFNVMNLSDLNFIEGSRMVTRIVSGSAGLCDRCRTFIVNAINEERRRIWAAIPSFFGLPGWYVHRTRLEELLS
ncbi:hypothetical protein SCHPADRAFT_1003168 [Schizopora paradoxa]|uniref:BTB domain-containing protein n=1 Tax=Schizopora paradoxa TaxID=27342 RepID=A0A0H2RJ62_9AGAM|nr:hypothetical protein SCHPADRAFT_1003168 [Schizopora paradoxa]